MTRFLSIGEAMVELSQTPAGHWAQGFAGDTLNTAWYARQCLGPGWQVAYFTCVGEDGFSHRFLEFLGARGIDAGHIRQIPGRTMGLYAIELTDGERSFSYWRGQSAARGLADDEGLLQAAILEADVVYLSGITLAILPPERRLGLLRLVGAARQSGKITAFDPNIRPTLWESAEAMRDALLQAGSVASVLLPSFEDEAHVFGDINLDACARRWRQAGAGEVVVKNGGGPILTMDGQSAAILTPERLHPLDSTGAGDAFNGGYLVARLQGHAPQAAAEAGHAIACQVIAQRGGIVEVRPPVAFPLNLK
jgi:2-dehydro-3-deoxygluconokinase